MHNWKLSHFEWHGAVAAAVQCTQWLQYNNCTPIKTYSVEYSFLLFLPLMFILCSLHSFPQSVWVAAWTVGSSIRVPQNVYPFQCGHSANGYIENKVIKLLSHWLNHRHTCIIFFSRSVSIALIANIGAGCLRSKSSLHAQLLTKWGSQDVITVARFTHFCTVTLRVYSLRYNDLDIRNCKAIARHTITSHLVAEIGCCSHWNRSKHLRPLKSQHRFNILFSSIIVLSTSFWMNESSVYTFILGLLSISSLL